MEDFQSLFAKQKQFFYSNKTKSISFRIQALEKLKAAIKKYESKLIDALKADLNKSAFDTYTTEIGIVYKEISFMKDHIKQWRKPEKVQTPLTHIGTKSIIYAEPYGSTLVIAPWNYPFQLAVAPMIGAIAAGNCVVLKPSELTPTTSDVLRQLVSETFSEEYVSVVEGAVETSQALLEIPFDYIFFTGSTSVGRIVMEQAAKHLTPVTLELGGKSPCIVDEDAHVKLAAKRIAWGKFTNAGQTCVAPDYVYVNRRIKKEFLEELKRAITDLYGENPIQNTNYTHIVNDKHFNRLRSFLDRDNIAYGGEVDSVSLVIEPTVLTGINWDDKVMEDEIFGPILPVLDFDDVDEIIHVINSHPKPLALYLFSENSDVQQQVISSISFGGGCINDTIYHLSSPYLPFGGVGASGMGAYHGKASFDTFSHKKSIMKQTNKFDIPLRYPNLKNGLRKIKRFLR
ncbi:aldehyde dehydrogenase [Aquibacillus koreensis]|uniref:Aldehyde dehydrogenase n=1 Tax=Aquibacillus koreensis TaxID=279446 RepID=A0A9X4AI26_9BACI|nr:aldehyde dehydrogenase [Aquibacillus koreensis]MCT2538028.1 aldehyde dehydrogenase [Aquibacillus koreensis]MDC3420551.1 aldehyde dehydrogenase [Aquibacillus koreensis]